jgi:ABC-type sugar transport system ATPase subunit
MNIIEGTFRKDHIELGDVVSIKVNNDTLAAHDSFYIEEIENANNRIEEIKRTLRAYEEENKKGDEPVIDEEAFNEEVNSDPEVIELRKSVAHYEDCLNNKEGHPILFGIRPEDIMEKTSAVLLKNPSDHMKLKVSIAELLGNEYYAHIDFLGKDVIAKVNAELNVEKDQILDLTFNLDKYCLFDKVNGRNIKPYKE